MKAFHQKTHFPLKYVTQKTGLSGQLIRTWEKRYEAVKPRRLANKRRVYSEDDIHRLYLLKRITDEGHAIGQIAGLSTKNLEKLHSTMFINPDEQTHLQASLKNHLDLAFSYIHNMQTYELDELLTQVSFENSPLAMIENLIVPLMYRIGEDWQTGNLTVSHEHMASAVIRFFLQSMSKAYRMQERAPKIIIATPSKHHHELGALVIAAIASSVGWNVIYLGANTPIADIAHTAVNYQAKAVALSLTFPHDYEINKSVIQNMRRFLPKEIPLYVGGKAIEKWRGVFNDRGIEEMANIHHFKKTLRNLANKTSH